MEEKKVQIPIKKKEQYSLERAKNLTAIRNGAS